VTQIKALTGHVVLVAPTQAEAFMRALSLLFWRYVRFSTKRLSGQVNMTSALDNRIITDMAIVIGRSKVMSRQRILDAILDTSGFQKKRPCAYPGVVESELADTISDQTARERMRAYRKMAIQPVP
jgi:hypothetical protein